MAHVYGTNDFLGAAVAGFCHHYGVPYVLEPLGMFQSLIRSHRKKMMYRRLVGSRVLHGASHVIATSEQERDELIQLGAPEERVVVRRNGIDLDQLTPVDPPGAFRGSIGVEDGERLIMFLGRLSPIKRLDVLISSFADLKEPNLKLAVVGPDEDGVQAGLSRLATTLGVASRVIFMGPIYGPSKAAAFQDADLFVLPSERESFGNAAAEALAFGTPVVVTEQCGIAPLVGGAGICIGQDGEELTAALRSLLLEEPARLAGMASHTRDVVSGLTWEEPALEMEGHYAAAIRRAP